MNTKNLGNQIIHTYIHTLVFSGCGLEWCYHWCECEGCERSWTRGGLPPCSSSLARCTRKFPVYANLSAVSAPRGSPQILQPLILRDCRVERWRRMGGSWSVSSESSSISKCGSDGRVVAQSASSFSVDTRASFTLWMDGGRKCKEHNAWQSSMQSVWWEMVKLGGTLTTSGIPPTTSRLDEAIWQPLL